MATVILFYTFSKSGSKWIGGIKNIYHDPCQDWMDLINMKLTSPNYPNSYDPLEHCSWNITAPQGQYVVLDFEDVFVRIYLCTRALISGKDNECHFRGFEAF